MRRRLLFAIVLVFAAALVQPAFAQAQRLRVAVDGQYPPYSTVDKKGRYAGFDIDMADEICKRIKMKCTKVPLSWDEMVDSVRNHKADIAVASVSITNARRQRGVAFSERYYHTPSMFMRRKGDDTVAGVWKDLRGKTIGVQGNTTQDQFVTSTFVTIATITRFTTLPEMIKALAAKKVDVILADAWALDRNGMHGKSAGKLEFTGPEYNDPKWFGEGMGVVLPADDPSLKTKIDDAIGTMREDGTYTKIASKYFSFDPYGD